MKKSLGIVLLSVLLVGSFSMAQEAKASINAGPFRAGDAIHITLKFDKAPSTPINLTIRCIAKGNGAPGKRTDWTVGGELGEGQVEANLPIRLISNFQPGLWDCNNVSLSSFDGAEHYKDLPLSNVAFQYAESPKPKLPDSVTGTITK